MFGSDLPLISNQLPISFDLPDEIDQWRIEMELMVKRINGVVNTKEGALYIPQEIASFNLYFDPSSTQKFRNVYRKTFDMVALNGGPLNPTTTYSFAHGITGIVDPTRIFGTATNNVPPISFLPLPYASTTVARMIEIYATQTNVIIITGNQTLTQCYITLEYTKN